MPTPRARGRAGTRSAASTSPGWTSRCCARARTGSRASRAAQETIAWAGHLAIVFPLWLGDMPALVKAFFEQLMRPDFAIRASTGPSLWDKLLEGRSARVVVTMGMPALFYRVVYRAHSVKSLERNILNFCGIAPVRTSLIGTIEGAQASRERWIARMRKLGKDAK